MNERLNEEYFNNFRRDCEGRGDLCGGCHIVKFGKMLSEKWDSICDDMEKETDCFLICAEEVEENDGEVWKLFREWRKTKGGLNDIEGFVAFCENKAVEEEEVLRSIQKAVIGLFKNVESLSLKQMSRTCENLKGFSSGLLNKAVKCSEEDDCECLQCAGYLEEKDGKYYQGGYYKNI